MRWQEAAVEARRMRTLLRNVVVRWENSALAGVWTRWVEHLWEAKRGRKLELRVLGRMLHVTCGAALDTWREVTRRERVKLSRMDTTRRRWLMNQAGPGFFRWREAVSEVRRMRGLLGKVVRRWEHMQQAGCFVTWA